MIANSHLILVAILLFSPQVLARHQCQSTSVGTSYEYRGLATGRSWIIDESERYVAFGGLASDYTALSGAGLRGFSSQGLVFAVPESIFEGDLALPWIYGGAEFNVSRTYALEVLGNRIPVLEIQSRQQVGDVRFLFSKERGLIALTFQFDDGPSDFFFLTKSCGYLAMGE